MNLLRKSAAEFVGTFALVFVGCGAVAADIGHLGVSIAFGLVVMVMIYATGHLSGAHFNPAVTLAFASAGRFPLREVPAYVASQSLAAIGAAFSLRGIFGEVSLGTTVPATGVLPSLGLEALLTYVLMFVITAVATDSRAEGRLAGVAIGGTVACAALMGGPISGASMNPARTLGPALATGEWTSFWVYLVGPIVGALAAIWTYRLIRCGGVEAEVKGCC